MGIVTFTCPTTGDTISTGIETDDESFALVDAFYVRLRCPLCGFDHEWDQINPRLVDELPDKAN